MTVSRAYDPSHTPQHLRAVEMRCACRNMLGRLTPRGIEVKCRRCKRIHVIPPSVLDQFHQPPQPASGEHPARSVANGERRGLLP